MNVGDLDGFARGLWLMVAGGAALGVVTMIAVQLLKDLMPLRRWCQKHWINGQVQHLFQESRKPPPAEAPAAQARRAANGPAPVPPAEAQAAQRPTAYEVEDLRNALSDLAAPGHDQALFDLPTDRLAGQLNTVAQVVLDFPDRYPNLVKLLAAGAAPDDLEKLQAPPPRAPALAAAPDRPLPEAEQGKLTAFVDARNRVAYRVQRNLDAVQMHLVLRWKFWVQVSSLLLSVGFAFATAFAVSASAAWQQPGWWATTVALGLLGGLLASVARDLVAALQRLRRGV